MPAATVKKISMSRDTLQSYTCMSSVIFNLEFSSFTRPIFQDLDNDGGIVLYLNQILLKTR